MTDVRKCDGPGCEESARLDSVDTSFTELSKASFITLEQRAEPDLHFHSQACLTRWSNKVTSKT